MENYTFIDSVYFNIKKKMFKTYNSYSLQNVFKL